MTDLYAARWRGQPGRLEVWYATLTDPATGLGLWLHHEMVAGRDGTVRWHGWAAAFPADGPPVLARFGPAPCNDTSRGRIVGLPGVCAAPERLAGSTGELAWDLRVADGGEPLFTFPRWAWERELLPAAQVVPAPTASFSGRVRVGGQELTVVGAPGAVARIYGHGNAERWGWLHADLGGRDVLEVVAAVSTRPGLRSLKPLPLLQLRVGGRTWPRRPLLAAPLLTADLRLPHWSVSGTLGRRRVRVAVEQDPRESVTVPYDDPSGPGPVCTNSERATADVLLERWSGRWSVERHWHLDRRAHAELGSRQA
ncbi:hypothetical protein [Oryzihumus sp.]|uniref:hypothetical protein n=1 Tax=Oryzihumus sp. TaxID=1968903 RepID=UPI002ED9DEE5